MEKLLLIGLGGGAGALLRYFLAGLLQRPAGPGFPLGTLVVNASGCFAIGALATLFAGPWLVREEHRLAVLVGVLGGYTTYSSFAWETLSLVNDGQYARAVLNVALTNVLALLGVLCGHKAAIFLAGATP